MARELGLEPRRFAKYADTKDQPWKLPLKEFIAALYFKQTGLKEPDPILTMEELAAAHVARRIKKKQAKAERLALEEEASEEEEESEDLAETETEPNGEEIPAVEVVSEAPAETEPEVPVEIEAEFEAKVDVEAEAEVEPEPEPTPISPWEKAVAARKQNKNNS